MMMQQLSTPYDARRPSLCPGEAFHQLKLI